MIDAVLLIGILWIALVTIVSFLFFTEEGTKGIEDQPYYGRKTGTIYTAKNSRSDHIV